MVGVAGKSKGCHTCRKRKIRCDQTKPTCNQCNKTGRRCGGYARTVTFLNNFAEAYRPSARTSEQADRDIKPASDSDGSNRQKVLGRSGHELQTLSPTHSDGQSIAQDLQLQVTGACPTVPRLIGLAHLQSDQALRNFLSCSLPIGAKEDVPLSWLHSVLDISKDSPVLPLAVSALTYAWTGHVQSLPEAVARARSFYVGALRYLNQALTEDPFSQSDAVLAASECLALYEMYEFGTESQSGWMAHLSGVEALVRLRGPQMHTAGLGHKMFLFFRTIAIFRAAIQRKSTFLAENEWKHIPWSLHNKNSFHQFLDLATEIPYLLERADILTLASPPPSAQSVFELFRDISSLLCCMNSWVESSKIRLPAGPPSISSFHFGTYNIKAISDAHAPPYLKSTTTILNNGSTPKSGSHSETQYILSPLALTQVYPGMSSRSSYNHVNNHPSKRNYPSPHPHLLGTPFDSLQTARLMQSLWVLQLTLYTTIYSSPLLRTALQLLSVQPKSPTGSENTGSTTTKISGPTEILSRENARILASKVALWSDFSTVSAWQSFGPVVALFTLHSTVDWFALDRKWETEEAERQRQLPLLRPQHKGSERRWQQRPKTRDSHHKDNHEHPHRYSRQAEMDKCLDLLRNLPGSENGVDTT